MLCSSNNQSGTKLFVITKLLPICTLFHFPLENCSTNESSVPERASAIEGKRMSSWNDTLKGEPLPFAVQLIMTIVGLPLCLTCILGNGVLLLAIYTQRHSQKSQLAFIVNLAFTDVIVVVTGLPFLVMDVVLPSPPVVGPLHCMLNGFVFHLSCLVSVENLVLVSFTRYMNVCHNRVFHRFFSFKRSVFACGLTWFLALIVCAPLTAGYAYNYDTRLHLCSVVATKKLSNYYAFVVISFMILPTVSIYSFNFKIFWFWRRSKRRLERRVTLKKSQKSRTMQSSPSAGFKKKSLYPDLGILPISPEQQQRNSLWILEDSFEEMVTPKNEDHVNIMSSFENFPRGLESSGNGQTSLDHARPSQIRRSRKRRWHQPRMKRCVYVVGDTGSEGLSGCKKSNCPPRPLEQDENSLIDSILVSLHPDCVQHFWGTSSLSDNDPSSPVILLSSRPVTSMTNDHDLGTTKDTYDKPTTTATTKTTTAKKTVIVVTRCEQKLINTLLAVTVSLFVLHTPYAVCVLVDIFMAVPAGVKVCAALLLFINNSIHWIIYGLMNTCLSKPYKDVVKACCFIKPVAP